MINKELNDGQYNLRKSQKLDFNTWLFLYVTHTI